ncbi:MAG: ribosome biogenesis GTP-binding protein YihA/YsxC [Vicinamibacterales bacterium]
MKVLTAAFVTSAVSAAGAPPDPGPRIALVGRSNVGKSSLINALAGQQIARTSATPGRTRLANFYRVTLAPPSMPPVWLVDLPGYGYARGGLDARRAFARVVGEFFGGGTGVPAALLVVDARHPGLEADRDARDWLAACGVEFGVVATKADKLSRAERGRAMRDITATLESPALAFSAATGEGRDDLWRMIAELARAQTPRPGLE